MWWPGHAWLTLERNYWTGLYRWSQKTFHDHPNTNMDPETDADRKHFYSSACTNCTCFNSHQISARGDPGVNMFGQVSRDGHGMSLAGGSVLVQWGPMSGGDQGQGSLYRKVPCLAVGLGFGGDPNTVRSHVQSGVGRGACTVRHG